MDGTILGQGLITASYSGVNPDTGVASIQAANAQIISIPSGADWIIVRNYTKSGAAGSSGAYFNGTGNAYVGVEHYWQLGMANGSAIVKYYSNTSTVLNGDTIASGGFTLYDPSGQTPAAQPLVGNPVAVTAVTNATQPVLSTSSTAGVSIGTIVRVSNTAQTDVNGIDFVVGAVVANTSITLLTSTNVLATVPGAIGGAGFYTIVYNGNSSLFYPRHRYITNITQAANAQVSTSVAHGLTPGQSVRFNIPSQSGMIQLNTSSTNNYLVPVVMTVVDDYNFTINVNSTSFTAFTYPTIAQEPCQPPIVVPFGENTAVSLASNTAQVPTIGGQQIFNTNTGILADSTVNTGYLGMILGSGGNGTVLTTPITGPAGTVNFNSSNVISSMDTLYWVAGKSTYGGQ